MLFTLGNPLYYVVVVLIFYLGGLVIAMINYMRKSRARVSKSRNSLTIQL